MPAGWLSVKDLIPIHSFKLKGVSVMSTAENLLSADICKPVFPQPSEANALLLKGW